MGVQCDGRTREFDSCGVGSIPAAPAMQQPLGHYTASLPVNFRCVVTFGNYALFIFFFLHSNAVVLHTSSFLAASLFGGVAFLCLFCGQQQSELGLLTSRMIDGIIYDE